MASAGTKKTKKWPKAAHKGSRGFFGTFLYWAPVWLPGILIGQIVFGGLRPSLAEETRLDRVETKLIGRELQIEEQAALQKHNKRMLEDEIYRERVHKSIGIPGEAPLKLQHDLPRHK